jgi:predicted RNase H-like nuclease (RuvC/YqgF family)
MTNLTELDQLLERVSARMDGMAEENAALRDELNKTKKMVEDKELDKIRCIKEKERSIEELERDKMSLRKEKEILEAKLDEVFKSLKSILPEANVERR